MIALPLIMLPTQRVWAGWGAAVYQQAQQIAASARSGVFDADLFTDDPEVSHADMLQALALLKQNRLAMFADPSWRLVGTPSKGAFRRSNAFGLTAHLLNTFRDIQTGLPAARFKGVVSYGIATLQRRGQLVVLDGDNTVVGLAEFSFINSSARSLRIDVPRKRGFDGYIRNYDAGKTYRLALLDATSASATVLTTLAATP